MLQLHLKPAQQRPLSAGEIALAKPIFQDSLPWQRLRLYFGSAWLPQNNIAMTPMGHIHFPRLAQCPDFSCQAPHLQAWLIHELVHTWQHSLGYPVWLGGIALALTGGYYQRRAYRLPELANITHFQALNIEQQAVLIEQFFLAQYQQAPYSLTHHRRLLAPFFREPRNHQLLPKLNPIPSFFR